MPKMFAQQQMGINFLPFFRVNNRIEVHAFQGKGDILQNFEIHD